MVVTVDRAHRNRLAADLGAVNHQQMPLLEALGRYQETIAAPFSAPGHKRGIGASGDLQALLGEDALAADVWLGISAHDPAQRGRRSRRKCLGRRPHLLPRQWLH
jgi:hypothetical protein